MTPSDLVNRLTESQRTCLRLVLEHMTSKEIGRALGLSPHTVDAHLKAAMKTLGVSSRARAALLLSEAENGVFSPDQPLVHQFHDMDSPFEGGHSFFLRASFDVDYTNLDGTHAEQKLNMAHEATVDVEASGDRVGGQPDRQRTRLIVGGNNLAIWKRILIIAGVASFSISVLLTALSVLRLITVMFK